PVGPPADRFAVPAELAGRGRVEEPQKVEKRRLPATARTLHREELPGLEPQRDIAERPDLLGSALAVGAGDARELDRGRSTGGHRSASTISTRSAARAATTLARSERETSPSTISASSIGLKTASPAASRTVELPHEANASTSRYPPTTPRPAPEAARTTPSSSTFLAMRQAGRPRARRIPIERRPDSTRRRSTRAKNRSPIARPTEERPR